MRIRSYIWNYDHIVNSGNLIAEYIKGYSNIHLLTEIPGNTGDQLIWEGTNIFLKNHKISFKEVKMQDLESISNINGCLLIFGSGALAKHFNEWLPETIEKASGCFANVIGLPSKVNIAAENVKRVLKLPNVTFFARDQRSF